jgi:hypothetical protein
MTMLDLSLSVRIAHIACYWKFLLLHYTQVLCQYRLCRADHAYLTYLMLQRQHSHFKVRKLDHRQVYAFNIFDIWLHIVLYCHHVHSQDFIWLVACCMYTFVVQSYTYGKLKAMRKSWTGVHLVKFSMVQRIVFSKPCSFKRYVAAAIFLAGQAWVISYYWCDQCLMEG